MPTLYLELNADKLVAGLNQAKASFKPVQQEAVNTGRVIDQNALSNRAYTATVEQMVTVTKTVPVATNTATTAVAANTAATIANAAAQRAMALAGTILTRTMGGFLRAIAITPMVALLTATSSLVIELGKAALGFDDASEEAEGYAEKVTAATEAVQHFNEVQAIGARLGVPAESETSVLDQRIAKLKEARDALIELERANKGATVPLDEAAQALGGGRKGALSAYRFSQQTDGFLGFGKETVVPAASLVRALNTEIAGYEKTLTSTTTAEKASAEAAKARIEIIGQLATAYNRLNGITAEGEAISAKLTQAGFSKGFAGAVGSVYSKVQGVFGGGGGTSDADIATEKAAAAERLKLQTEEVRMRARLNDALETQAEREANVAKLEAEKARADAIARQQFERSASGFASGFDAAANSIFSGMNSLGGAFEQFAQSVANQVLQQTAIEPAANAVGAGLASWLGTLGAAQGRAFDQSGEVKHFAYGDIFDSPTRFRFGGGRRGEMGEAGPEAVMPLRRGADGRLGVAAAGGGGNTTINVNLSGVEDHRGMRQSAKQAALAVDRSMRRR